MLRSLHLLNPHYHFCRLLLNTWRGLYTDGLWALKGIVEFIYCFISSVMAWNTSIWKSTTPSQNQRLRNHTSSPLTMPLLVSPQLRGGRPGVVTYPHLSFPNYLSGSICPVVHSCPLSSSVTPQALPCWQQRPRKCPSYNSNYFSSFSVLLRCSFTFLPGSHTAALPWQARSSLWKEGDGFTRASLHLSTFLGLFSPIPSHQPASSIIIYPRINITNCTL